MGYTYIGDTKRLAYNSGGALDDITPFTWYAWFFPTQEASTRFIVEKGSGNRRLRMQTSGTDTTIEALVGRGTTNATAVSTSLNYHSLGVWSPLWTFVAMSYSESGGIRLYHGTPAVFMDEMSYASRVVGSGSTVSDSGSNLRIAGDGSGSDLKGSIDCFGYVGAALSGDEIAHLYIQPMYPHPNLKLLLEFSYSDPATLPDLSGVGNVVSANNGVFDPSIQAPLSQQWGWDTAQSNPVFVPPPPRRFVGPRLAYGR